jgi:heptosyltransferase I
VSEGRRVAIVLLSAIGDIVHALPLANSLKRASPGDRLEWIAQPVPAEILHHHPAVDRVWTLDRRRGWRGFVELYRALRGERFDLVLDLQVYAKASLVTLMIRSPRKLGFDVRRAREGNWLVTSEKVPALQNDHVCEQYLEFADHLGVPRLYDWQLPLTPGEIDAQEAFFGQRTAPVVALVVGTSRPAKEWPTERWAALSDALRDVWGYEVVIVGSDQAGERERAHEIARRARRAPLDERRNDLRRLIWLLDGAALVVSCDTGPYHLAVALGVPTIGLYGATDPARAGPGHRFLDLVVDAYHDPGEPWHPARTALRAGRMDRIPLELVLEAVERARARYPRAVEGPTSGAGLSAE